MVTAIPPKAVVKAGESPPGSVPGNAALILRAGRGVAVERAKIALGGNPAHLTSKCG